MIFVTYVLQLKGSIQVEAFIEHVNHMMAMVQEVKQMSKHFNDAIQLTTIHRAKGLEYKSVYILAAVDGSLPHDFRT